MNNPLNTLLDKAYAQRTITGRTYQLKRLPMIEAGRIASRVGKSLLPALAGAQGLNINDTAQLSATLSSAVDHLDVNVFYDDALHCLKQGCHVGELNIGETHAFEKHFLEYPQDLFPCLLWALQENIGGFFGLGAASPSNQAVPATPSTFQKTGK